MKIGQFLNEGAWGDVTPETLKKGMGGRETALVQLSEAWARQGEEVINFVSVEEPKHYENSHYVNFSMTPEYIENFGLDVLVSWEKPEVFGLEAAQSNVKLKMVEMQVAHLEVVIDGNNHDPLIDNYAVLSQWAGDFLCNNEPAIDKDKLVIFSNGVDLTRYPEPSYGHPGEPPYKFFYSSSPDRGLHHLFRVWPQITAMYPGSELHIAYGVEKWANLMKWSHNLSSEVALDVLEGVNQPGVIYHGKIGQDKLAQIQTEADMLLYPCDPSQPTETGCITAIEAGAACTPMLLTEADCLDSEFSDCAVIATLPFSDGAYIDGVKAVMDNPEVYVALQQAGRQKAESRSWDLIGGQWLSFFRERLN